jgi:hypothetical protein
MNEERFAGCNLQLLQNTAVAVCIKVRSFLSVYSLKRWIFSKFISGISPAKNLPVTIPSIFMCERNVESHHSTTMTIPVEFGTDLQFDLQIKAQANTPMNAINIISEKPLIPGLFQIAAYADDARSVSALKNAMASNRLPLNEMALDAERLEAILKNMAEKKKAQGRRTSIRPFEKSLV